MAKNKKEILQEISGVATDLLKEGKNPVEVKPVVTEAVLEATASVIKSELVQADAKSVTIPHLGIFKPKFVPAGLKPRRNPQTGETFMANVPDKHKVTFKFEKKFNESFNAEKLASTKK